MSYSFKSIIKNIVTISLVAMFFSCNNNSNIKRNLLLHKNLPISVGKDIFHKYKDSGRITSKMVTPLLKDFSNRENHPYNEFPNGIKIVSYKNKGKDSITIIGDYALAYLKTQISELKGNVIIINHTDESKLETEQLFWDETTNYFYSEKEFKLTSSNGVTNGIGFESKQDLTKFLAKKMTGNGLINEN